MKVGEVKSAPGRLFALSIRATAALFVVAVALTALALMVNGHGRALKDGAQRAERFVSGAEASLNRNLLGIDMMLAELPELLAHARDGSASGLDLERAQALLAGVPRRDLTLREVTLAEEDGTVLVSSDPATMRAGLKHLEPFLKEVAQQVMPHLAVSRAAVNFLTAERSLYFARRVSFGDRTFIALTEVRVNMLAALVAQGAAAEGLQVTVERFDGHLLAAVPQNDRVADPVRSGAALTDERLTGRVEIGPGRLDGQAALMAARPTLARQVLVTAAMPVGEALLAWRAERNTVLGGAGVFLVLIACVAFLAGRNARQIAQARAEIVNAKTTLDQALEAMSDGFLLCDAGDKVTVWNQRYLELFPWQEETLRVGAPFADLIETAARHVLPDAQPHERAAWARLRQERRLADGSVHEQMLPGGRVVHSVERATPDGGIVSVYRDITAAERRLRQALDAAEAANESKSRFLAAMSHEIRTPLNAVLGLNGLMLESDLNAAQRHHAELIQSSGRSLLALINDILDLSKVEAGRMELKRAAFSPWAVVKGVGEMFTDRAAERGLSLRVECQPSTAPAPWVLGDEERLRQVVMNLVGNAMKFTERGQVHVLMRHAPTITGDVTLRLEVRDTGIGVPANALPQLFDRFTQADNSRSRRYGGSGLGLAICREIVELMGGHIDVHSEEGKGSTFTVDVRLPHTTEQQPAGPALMPGMEPTQLRHRLHVLVAEDNTVNQVLIRALLERMGHDCDIVDDGRAAVAQLQASEYDLVLMDVQMPEMDGEAATRAIRTLPRPHGAVPIVAVTANAMAADREAYFRAGMNAFVSKPIDPEALVQAMAQAMARSAAPAPKPVPVPA